MYIPNDVTITNKDAGWLTMLDKLTVSVARFIEARHPDFVAFFAAEIADDEEEAGEEMRARLSDFLSHVKGLNPFMDRQDLAVEFMDDIRAD
jgi:hypothetical protein